MYFVSHLSRVSVPALIKEASLANEGHDRKPQLDTRQRWQIMERPTRMRTSVAQILDPPKRGQKDCKSQNSRKSAVKQSFLEIAAQTRLEPCQHPWT